MPVHRRRFLQTLGVGTGGLLALGCQDSTARLARSTPKAQQLGSPPKVGLVKGNDRRANMLEALEIVAPDIREAIRGRQIVIKPNLTRVAREDWLASTHVDSISALCEMFSSITSERILIAEGTGPGKPIQEALESYDYLPLQQRFNVEFVDLQKDDFRSTYILDRAFQPEELRISELLTRSDVFLVSAAVMKTHSLSVVTLGLKNLIMAMPMNFGGRQNDRARMHQDRVADDPRPFNWNLFQLSRLAVPDLVTIDGFLGMQGNGPLNGDPVESKVAVAGLDWLATDRVGIEVMGADFARIGHYRFCAEAGMGEADLSRIEVVGNTVGECRREYAPPDSLEQILMSA